MREDEDRSDTGGHQRQQLKDYAGARSVTKARIIRREGELQE